MELLLRRVSRCVAQPTIPYLSSLSRIHRGDYANDRKKSDSYWSDTIPALA